MESRSNSEILKKNIEDWFYHLTSTGIAPNEAAARAIQLVKSGKLYREGFFTCSHFSKGWSLKKPRLQWGEHSRHQQCKPSTIWFNQYQACGLMWF